MEIIFSQYKNTYPIDVDESSWTGAGSAGRSKDNNFSAASLTADSSAVSTGWWTSSRKMKKKS